MHDEFDDTYPFRCRETGEYAKCPNGHVMDVNIGVADELRDCRVPDW